MQAARAAGNRRLAAALGRLRRPTVSAYVLNLLVRDQPEVGEQLVELGEELRRAQEELSGPALRQLATQRQQLVGALVRSARKIAAGAGVTGDPGRRVRAGADAARRAGRPGRGRGDRVRAADQGGQPDRVRRDAAGADDDADPAAAGGAGRRAGRGPGRGPGAPAEGAARGRAGAAARRRWPRPTEARDEAEQALATAEHELEHAERDRVAATELVEELRAKLAAAEDAEREAVRHERDAQRERDAATRRRDAAARKAEDAAARLADL